MKRRKALARQAHQGFTTKDSGKRQEFASGMKRDTTEGKIDYLLIRSGPMFKRWAELMARGAVKYDEDNWLQADSEDELERFKVSAARHFEQWVDGDTDEDHAAAVIFNMNGYEYVREGLGVDQYPEPCVEGELITCYCDGCT